MILVSAAKARLAVPNQIKTTFLFSSCLKIWIMKWYVAESVLETPGDAARAGSGALRSDKVNLLCWRP